MDFPNLLELPEDQVHLVLQGYMAGMTDQKASIMDLIENTEKDTEDLVVKAALIELLAVLSDDGDGVGE